MVEPVSWENIKYTLDEKTKEISEEVVGTFTQIPLRLAWSITIHKSQGLTFERAIIDAQAAFSHGQVYVALSRCKTFEGMVLSSPLSSRAVKTDTKVAQFVDDAGNNPATQQQLTAARIAYQQQLLLECFDFHPIANSLGKLSRQLRDNQSVIQSSAIESLQDVERQFGAGIFSVADKFKRQLQSLFRRDVVPENDPYQQERVQKASRYFGEKLQSKLIPWASGFDFEADNKKIRTRINNALQTLHRQLAVKSAALQSCRDGFATGNFLDAVARAEIDSGTRPIAQATAKKRGGKNTRAISYELFLQGKGIQEIADMRGLVRGTIETHLAHFVGLGELDVNDLVAPEKVALIKEAAEGKGRESLSLIKEHLGDRCSYGEIRLVLESMDR